MKNFRRFELVDGSSNKFWEIAADGSDLAVRFGKIGTSGTSQSKSFDSADACAKEAAKLIREKTKKGYSEVGASASVAANQPATKQAAAKASPAKAPAGPPRSGDDVAATYRSILDLAAMSDPHLEIPPPATPEELADVERAIGFALPDAVRTMLEISNGATAALFLDEGSLFSTSQMIEAWKFCSESSDADLRCVPIGNEQGIYAYVVADPDAKDCGRVAAWDTDGESYGERADNEKLAKSLGELLTAREAKLRKALPKGMPVVPGFAFGAQPTSTDLDAIVASLGKARRSIHAELTVLSRNRALLKSVVERLLEESKSFLAYEEHDEILEQLAAEIDLDVILRAFRKRDIKELVSYEERYLEGWTLRMENVLVTLLARDAARVHAAAPTFAPVVHAGYTLLRRRLGQLELGDISPALREQVAKQANHPPRSVLVPEGSSTRRIEAPDFSDFFTFALSPYFNDMAEHGRILMDFVIASPDLVFPRWYVGPCLRVASAEEAVTLFSRMQLSHYDILQARVYAGRALTALLVEAVAITRLNRNAQQELAWGTYVVATREEQPLPSFDALAAGVRVVDSSSFAKDYAPTLAALGPARVAAMFPSYPQVVASVAASS